MATSPGLRTGGGVRVTRHDPELGVAIGVGAVVLALVHELLGK
ncbi:hypothetical protein [Streptomyces mirabilis]|uniref:Uncharacterized protein n=1 Tax=Streptomyces mirabilis TaxID=68239 RepID=A0ABU3V4U7_9ACTN|nr:hypothetical protein [Streptomyces mirabilis]MCX5355539.1 hypothetical protein [Streptomyces mirabilis]MDU9001186.1 hypothetical protein [Streptomyces mirabilis]